MAEEAGRAPIRIEDERAVLRAWGATIRRYRQWQRLSRRELAARAGMSPVYLGEIERGEKDASVHTLSLIAAALGIRLGELYLRVATALDTAALTAVEAQPALPIKHSDASKIGSAGMGLEGRMERIRFIRV